jgi:5'(3')-deoxyribonucleotidase
MIKEIIEFFKKLFGKEEISVNEVSYINDSDIIEEDNIIKTKILLNNNISGYDIKKLSIKSNDSIIEDIEIPDKESRVVVLSTNE